jgi:hypothetical protein
MNEWKEEALRSNKFPTGPTAGGIRLTEMHVTHVLGYKF